jgi:hemolysin activation/secretion protein
VTGGVNLARYFFLLLVLMPAFHMTLFMSVAAGDEGKVFFEIRTFNLVGNSIFPADTLQETVKPFTGSGKTAADVEKARDSLEKRYHNAGYPAVMVNIPEQTVATGVVTLHIVESRIGRVRITGNRYYTLEKIMRDIPSLNPGQMLYLPSVQREVGLLNRNQDFKVAPFMSQGREPGTIDVDLKVEDRLPLHGSLEVNNRATHETSELRLNAMLRYDNLWQRDHSLSLQYQMSPQKASEVEVAAASYALPAPWNEEHQMALYGIWSGSETIIAAQGIQVAGKGNIVGLRYVIPLLPYKLYVHNLTAGVDYKSFKDSAGYADGKGGMTSTPLTYLPFSFSYSGFLQDAWGGTTQLSGGLNMAFRDVVGDNDEFALKRYKATSGYLYATAGIQRTQKLPWGMGLFVKIDGQAADQPLVSNEQYAGGGMESVRGYKEAEALGDHAVHLTAEVSLPDPLERFGFAKHLQLTPFVFYDRAEMMIIDPLPGQDRTARLEGVGAGLRGSLMKHLDYEVDWAWALSATDKTASNTNRLHFKLKAFF